MAGKQRSPLTGSSVSGILGGSYYWRPTVTTFTQADPAADVDAALARALEQATSTLQRLASTVEGEDAKKLSFSDPRRGAVEALGEVAKKLAVSAAPEAVGDLTAEQAAVAALVEAEDFEALARFVAPLPAAPPVSPQLELDLAAWRLTIPWAPDTSARTAEAVGRAAEAISMALGRLAGLVAVAASAAALLWVVARG